MPARGEAPKRDPPRAAEQPPSWIQHLRPVACHLEALPRGIHDFVWYVDLAFTRWKPPPGEPKLAWRVTYCKAQIISDDGGRGVAEIELVRRLRAANWSAGWVDNFGQAPPDFAEWLLDSGSFPPSLRQFDEILGTEHVGAGRPDIFAWRSDSLADAVFVECKSPGDKLGPAQEAWFRAALHAGMSRDQFAIARWRDRSRTRSIVGTRRPVD